MKTTQENVRFFKLGVISTLLMATHKLAAAVDLMFLEPILSPARDIGSVHPEANVAGSHFT